MTSDSSAKRFRLVAPSCERDADGNRILELTGTGDVVLLAGMAAATAFAVYAAVTAVAGICDVLWTIAG